MFLDELEKEFAKIIYVDKAGFSGARFWFKSVLLARNTQDIDRSQ
jgi:hypothetical protein